MRLHKLKLFLDGRYIAFKEKAARMRTASRSLVQCLIFSYLGAKSYATAQHAMRLSVGLFRISVRRICVVLHIISRISLSDMGCPGALEAQTVAAEFEVVLVART